jgi:hypothetical protein
MTRNTAKIKSGIQALTHRPHEIITGTVAPGSVDSAAYTMSVQASDESAPIEGVMLNVISGDGNGLILIPKDGSNVIISSVDGQGEWALIKTSEIVKAIITIEGVTCEIDNTEVSIKNGSIVFNVGASVFKMNTAGESLFQLLNDLITALTVLTVGTGAGPSTVPTNLPTFNSLLTRLGNLLSA